MGSSALEAVGGGAAAPPPDQNEGEARTCPEQPRVAIVGVPNCGKSMLFNRLTGAFAASSNYPYTTTELEEKQVELNGRRYTCIDTPAISGLELVAEEEAPTVEMLRSDPPDIIVQCMDAGNLNRSLLLAAELAELEIPSVVCLNMIDEAAGKGIYVDPDKLSEKLRVPVTATCALDGRGVKKLVANLERARCPQQACYPDCLQSRLNNGDATSSRSQRLAALMGRSRAELEPGQNPRRMALESHRRWATEAAQEASKDIGLEPASSLLDTLSRFALHPVGAWIALLSIIPIVYLLVAQLGATLLAGSIDEWLVAPAIELIASLTGPGLLHDILVGDHGLLSLGLFNALGTVLPILTVFYLFFGLLEDVGYFPLLSVQFDRLLRTMGLNGKSVLPITLGFGCNAVATMAIRCLDTRRERFIAAFLISLGIPCACQLGVIVAILAVFPLAAVLGMVGIIVALQIAAGTFLARILPDHARHGEFLVELPPLRAPRWRNVIYKTYHRVREFLFEAAPMFMAGAGLLLALELTGLLDRIREVLAPVVVGALGLPAAFADGMMIALARRELGALMLKDMLDAGQLSFEQAFVGLLVMILFVPCMTTSMILWRTLGWRQALTVFLAVIAIAIGAGSVVNYLWI